MTELHTGSVVSLTPELLGAGAGPSALLWLVNICRQSCGFCQALQPRWAKLAQQLQHEVVVATWDAHWHPKLPPMLGVANSTPTIRALVPHASGTARLVDYEGRRELADLAQFAGDLMPSHVVVVDGPETWQQAAGSAAAAHLPRLLCFVQRSASASTPRLLKALSSTLFGRLIVVEVRMHGSVPGTVDIAQRLGVSTTPSVLWMHADEPVWHTGPPTFRRMREFAEAMLSAPQELAMSISAARGAEPAAEASQTDADADAARTVHRSGRVAREQRDEL